MKFCENCGSYMKETIRGFSCPRCGKKIYTEIVEIKYVENSDSPVYVVDDSKN